MNMIHIVGLGPGSKQQLSIQAYEMLLQEQTVYVRTADHPLIQELVVEGVNIKSFDHIYEQELSFDRVYENIVKHLLDLVSKKDILYAVPGHPMVAEQTVQLLLEKAPKQVRLVSSHSFLDEMFTTLRIDPNDGFLLLDGTALDAQRLNPHLHVLISQIYAPLIASDVKISLMDVYPDEYRVKLIINAGMKESEQVQELPLYELDHHFQTSNLTTLYVPPATDEAVLNRQFATSRSIFRTLRGDQGCPWDKQQTHESLKKYAQEEVQELLLAIDEGDVEHIQEELGDVLLQVFLYAQIAEDEGMFNMEDVLQTLNAKMIRRHPHVFGDEKLHTAEQVRQKWQEIKETE